MMFNFVFVRELHGIAIFVLSTTQNAVVFEEKVLEGVRGTEGAFTCMTMSFIEPEV